MATFVQVTDKLAGEQWINAEQIVLIRRGPEGGALLVLASDRDQELTVEETPEAILAQV
jgi:hypothetical protein